MIPREILKKNRQIKIRMNRLVKAAVGTVRRAVQRRVQRRNDSDRVSASHPFRPLLRGRGHRSAMSLPGHTLRFGLRPQPPSVYSAFRTRAACAPHFSSP